jgi:hypothetical protein
MVPKMRYVRTVKVWFEQLVLRVLEVTPDVSISVQEIADEEDQ